VKSLVVKDGKVTLEMGPFSFATIRFNGPKTALAKVAGFKGEAVSDKSIKLTWEAVPKAAAYLVYRSEDPAAPATAYSLVGRSVEPTFTDDWLKIGTDYYYYVAPVSAFNQQGGLSGPLAVAAGKNNVSPPRELSGLGIIRQGPRELKVYWDKAPEPDVARYYVYRSQQGDAPAGQWQNVATVPANARFLQTWLDATVSPATTYFYKVFAEDWAGHRQTASKVTSAGTPPEQKIEQVKKDENQ
jgi:fibronectin type 3 domain-containing protein